MSEARLTIAIMSRLYDGVAGGIERMSIALANEMSARGHDVHLISWDHDEATPYYPLDDRVTWHKLDLGDATIRAGWRTRLARIAKIRRLIRRIRPGVVMAFQLGMFRSAVLATLGTRAKVIAAERNAPDRYDHLKAGKRRGRQFQTFRLADRITVQFPDYVDGYPAYLRKRIVAIENPVLSADGKADPAGSAQPKKRLISVGRLSYQKNQSALITAFSSVLQLHPDWRLVLIGDGEDEAKLREFANAAGVMAQVEFTGAIQDVSTQYRTAHLFCLASRWEGFPNAVAEAMAHGLPCVGFRGCAGMPQLISDGVTGALAAGNDDPKELAATLDRLMLDDTARAKMGRQGRATVAKYEPGLIFDRWEAFFMELCTEK